MSTKSVISLRLDLKPSRLLEKLTVVVHVSALAACLANALPLALRLPVAAAVAISLILSLKANRATCRSIELQHSAASGWMLVLDGETQAIELLASTLSISWLVVLHYRLPARSLRTMTIFRDAVGDNQYRKLRVALRVVAGS